MFVCRPYRLEKADRLLLERVKNGGRRLSFTRFVLIVGLLAALFAAALHVLFAHVLAEVVPVLADPITTVPLLAWLGTLAAGVFFARRIDAAAAVMPATLEQTVTVSPDGIRAESVAACTDWHWPAWARFHDFPEGLALEETTGAVLVLPARVFPDAAARAAIRDLIGAHVALVAPPPPAR